MRVKEPKIIPCPHSDYFEMTGKIFKETNGEALHHTLKTMEKNKGSCHWRQTQPLLRSNRAGVWWLS